jgi:hypothetical protein
MDAASIASDRRTGGDHVGGQDGEKAIGWWVGGWVVVEWRAWGEDATDATARSESCLREPEGEK